MSFPSVVTFFKDEEQVKQTFTNCGLFVTDKSIKNGIRRSLKRLDETFEWDTALAYGTRFAKTEIESDKL